MKYEFFLNVEKDEQGRNVGFFGYNPGHALQPAYKEEIDTDIMRVAADMLFEKFNVDHPADYHQRSMSVGDVIVFPEQGAAFSCSPIGWSLMVIPANCKEVD